MPNRISFNVFLLLTIAAIAHNVHYMPLLPPIVASHFNAAGKVDGWMPTRMFSLFYLGTTLLLFGTFFLTGWIMRRVPDRFINLPNKSYWLDPSRREETRQYLASWNYRFGSAVMLFLIAIMHMVIRVNLERGKGLPPSFFWVFGAFIAYSIAMTIALMRRFRKRGDGEDG